MEEETMKAERKLIAGLSAAAIALSCMSFASFADAAVELNSFEATSDNVKILGRAKYMEDAGALWFGLTDAGVEFDFTGTTAVLNISADSAASSDSSPARIAIYADGKLYKDTTTMITPRDYEVKFDENSTHTVRLMKLSECPNGTIRLNEIKTDSESIAPTAEGGRKIEFIGDSITCGYGVDATSGGFSTKTEDGSKTYAYKTAQKLNADYSMVSFSGYGIISGYSNNGKRSTQQCVPDYYDKLGNSWGAFSDGKYIQNETWDFAGFTPDLVVVNLGTNDASYINSIKGDNDLKNSEKEAFTETYEAFIGQIREANPNAEILCTLGIMGQDLCPQVEAAVNNYKTNTGDEHVNYLKFNIQNTEKNGVGVDWHPAPQSHIDAAYELLGAIEEFYGWQGDPDVDIDLPVERTLTAKDSTDIEINEISSKGTPVSVVLSPAAEESVTFTVDDTTIASVFGEAEVEPGVGKSVGAAENGTVTVTTDAETGEATVYVYGNNEGTATLTASTDDGLSVTFNVNVDVEADSIVDPDESSAADNSSEASSESQSDSSSASSSSSNSSKSNSSAAANSNAAPDNNPATGAAAGAAAAVILLAMGTIVASKKSKD